MLGDMAISAGDVDAAGSHLAVAVREWRRLDDAAAMARVLNLTGWAAAMRGDFDDAAPLLEEAVARARAGTDAAQLSSSLHSLGELHRLQDTSDTRRLLEESLEVATEAGWRHLIWWPSLSLAALARQHADLDVAAELLGRAVRLCPKLARRARHADCLDELALLRLAQGRSADAAMVVGASDVCRAAIGVRRPPVYQALLDDLTTRIDRELGAAALATGRRRGEHAGAAAIVADLIS